jgi:hypothetical protein
MQNELAYLGGRLLAFASETGAERSSLCTENQLYLDLVAICLLRNAKHWKAIY